MSTDTRTRANRDASPTSDPEGRGNGKIPAAVYLRRSTDRQEKSLEDQRKEIIRYAAEHGFGIVAEFVDDGVSGTSGETRKGFLSMLEEAQSPGRAWCSILVWDVKRFGRMSSDEVGYYRWLFKQAGVEIIYTSEGFTGSSADKFLRFFKQEAARDESATLSKAVIRGLVSLADQGWWPGGMAPYGYDLAYYDQTGRLFQIVRATGARDKVDSSDIWTLTEAVEFDLDKCTAFLKAYHAASPLSDDELAAIPPAFEGRWLSVRLEGMAKVPEERRLEFFGRGDIHVPAEWLDAHWPQVRSAAAG